MKRIPCGIVSRGWRHQWKPVHHIETYSYKKNPLAPLQGRGDVVIDWSQAVAAFDTLAEHGCRIQVTLPPDNKEPSRILSL